MCVCPFTLSNMNISETSRPITIKFYLKHHWGGGKTALDFGADWFTSLVYMATDSFHRVIDIMGKMVLPIFMPQTLKKWGAYWFGHVRACVRPFKKNLKLGF